MSQLMISVGNIWISTECYMGDVTGFADAKYGLT